jgi:hypothetical protein
MSKNAVRCVVLSMRDVLKMIIVTDAVATVYSLGDLGPALKNYLSTDPIAKVTEVTKETCD